jgi:hypothetical protein
MGYVREDNNYLCNELSPHGNCLSHALLTLPEPDRVSSYEKFNRAFDYLSSGVPWPRSVDCLASSVERVSEIFVTTGISSPSSDVLSGFSPAAIPPLAARSASSCPEASSRCCLTNLANPSTLIENQALTGELQNAPHVPFVGQGYQAC